MTSRRTLGLTAGLVVALCLVRLCQLYDEQLARNAALDAAVEKGDGPGILRALDAGAYRKPLGNALFRVVEGGDREVAMQLLSRGAPTSYHDPEGRTALGMALRGGDAELVGALVDHGAKASGWGKRPPLLVAATLGSTDVVEALFRRGADPNELDHDTATPLIRAAEQGHTGVVRLLLAHGADPNLGDRNGRTALDRVRVRRNSPIARLLRQAGARE